MQKDTNIWTHIAIYVNMSCATYIKDTVNINV